MNSETRFHARVELVREIEKIKLELVRAEIELSRIKVKLEVLNDLQP